MRYLLLLSFFFAFKLSAQRDSIINGVKCHLISESRDTGTAWIQKKVVKKRKKKTAEVFQGYYFEVYPGGKLKVKGFFKRGKRNQEWFSYYPDGKIASQGYYKNGMKSDLWKMYYSNGNLKYRGMYYEDIHSGFCYQYYENGVLKSKTRYVITTLRTQGDVKVKKPGSLIKTRTIVHQSVTPVDSLVEYYPNGKLKSRIIYDREGRLNGTCDFYYENGNKNFSGQYSNGKKSGTWVYFCVDGSSLKFIKYDDKGEGVPEKKSFDAESACGYSEIHPEIQWTTQVYPPIN